MMSLSAQLVNPFGRYVPSWIARYAWRSLPCSSFSPAAPWRSQSTQCGLHTTRRATARGTAAEVLLAGRLAAIERDDAWRLGVVGIAQEVEQSVGDGPWVSLVGKCHFDDELHPFGTSRMRLSSSRRSLAEMRSAIGTPPPPRRGLSISRLICSMLWLSMRTCSSAASAR